MWHVITEAPNGQRVTRSHHYSNKNAEAQRTYWNSHGWACFVVYIPKNAQ